MTRNGNFSAYIDISFHCTQFRYDKIEGTQLL